ncbi:hypothetical protein HU200_045770 [Digitaria exilis]|uniref:Uncharacterized protein n=1 Tax=Digitaria exilis TaxID=1010633 RepID=A0A835E9P8_9POAL|nr:hypothetical protein HU200_045770 [Digitaria exilis]
MTSFGDSRLLAHTPLALPTLLNLLEPSLIMTGTGCGNRRWRTNASSSLGCFYKTSYGRPTA